MPPESFFQVFDAGIPLMLAAGAGLLFFAGSVLVKRIDWSGHDADEPVEHAGPAERLSLEDVARRNPF